MQLKVFALFVVCAFSLLLLPESRGKTSVIRVMEEEEEDPPEVAAGERLFRETRFAQYFFAHAAGPNQPLEKGDPSLYQMKTAKGAPLQNPYIGKSMNCAACHLVDEALDQEGMRSYADFSLRSFVPYRAEDRESETPRNSPALVGAVRPGATFLHFDGEFVSAEDLVIAGWVGRNNGWLASEEKAALRHVARILREDDGSLSEDGVSYRSLFTGTYLPAEFRVDPATASDEKLIFAAASLVRVYMESLEFARTSAFDLFLEKNGLPGEPAEGEAPEAFHQRLLSLLQENTNWVFVDEALQLHAHPSRFGPEQLKGLKLFLDPKRGNCASCHQLPHFTDSLFHNTGISQFEYDRVHGPAAFMALRIPSLGERAAVDLPADAGNLLGLGTYRAKAVAADPRQTDLGLWNIFANPSYPKPQVALEHFLCGAVKGECGKSKLLEASLGRFKTPSLRDLGHSGPFFHNGSALNLEDSVVDYVMASMLARQGDLRNGAPELMEMNLHGRDARPLAAFLESLDEDYE